MDSVSLAGPYDWLMPIQPRPIAELSFFETHRFSPLNSLGKAGADWITPSKGSQTCALKGQGWLHQFRPLDCGCPQSCDLLRL